LKTKKRNDSCAYAVLIFVADDNSRVRISYITK